MTRRHPEITIPFLFSQMEVLPMSVLRLEPAEAKPCSCLQTEGLVGLATVLKPALELSHSRTTARPGAPSARGFKRHCLQKAHTLTSDRGSHRGLHATPPLLLL